MKCAFTMIELVFVIVILGILAGIAVPRIFVARDDAIIVKTRSQIANIQSSIANIYSLNMMSGNFSYPDLDNKDERGLFGNVLQIAISPKSSDDSYGWSRIGKDTKYQFSLKDKTAIFTYDKNKGLFSCDLKDDLCLILTN